MNQPNAIFFTYLKDQKFYYYELHFEKINYLNLFIMK